MEMTTLLRPLPSLGSMPQRSKVRPAENGTLETKRFKTGEDIREALHVSDVSQLTTNLIALRNQWTIRHDEPLPIASDDERLLLAKNYLAHSPSATEIFKAWELLSKQSIIHQHLALGVFSSLLSLLSAQYIYHSIGLPVLKALLATPSTRRLNAHLNSAQTDLVLVALKLWNAMAEYGVGMEKRRVFEEFAWGNKSLFRLFNMRRKGNVDLSTSPFIKPDIRTLYIIFILQFIQPASNLHFIKSTFLESHREVLLAIFKRLHEDPYPLVRTILEASWEGIWQDNRVKKTVKIGLFGEKTLNLLIKLYARATAEMSDPESIPADLIHHFLLALCTRPGVGLCFKDNGWYPRQEDDEFTIIDDEIEDPDSRRTDENSQMQDKSGKTYNRILGNLLKSLRPTEDARHQELALKILQACPELVYGYWSSSGLAMEPRLASKWLINIAWMGSIVSLPIPSVSFYLSAVDPSLATTSSAPNRREYSPTPPPLAIILSNILPSLWSKTLITKGLQNTSPLVQRATALCLAQALEKYELVVLAFQEVEDALEEDVGEGRWKTRRQEIEKEMKKRVPNFEVIIAFSQIKSSIDSTTSQWGTTEFAESDKILKNSILLECALRLMWLYHRSLPDLPAEARYDVGKLILSGAGRRLVESLTKSSAVSSDSGKDVSNIAGFDLLSQLHVLKLLQHSDQFIWHATLGETNQTHLYHLLHLYVLPVPSIISKQCADVIKNVLGPSILFEHDPPELLLWLEALPRGIRAHDAKGPNGEELVDERETMIAILDKCIRECIKSPWKYVERTLEIYTAPLTSEEATEEMTSGNFEGYGPSSAASPLLMTLLEFFEGILKGEPALPPAAALSVATYLRRLLLGITLKQPNMYYVLRITSRLDLLLSIDNSETQAHSLEIIQSIHREFTILRGTLLRIEVPADVALLDDEEPVLAFLNRVENLVVDDESKASSAYDLIDWLRLGGQRITPDSALRVIKVVGEWYPPALEDVIFQIDPSQSPIASALQTCGYLQNTPLLWAYLHASTEDLGNKDFLDEISKHMARGSISDTRAICEALLRRLQSSLGSNFEERVIFYTCTLWGKAYSLISDSLKKDLHRQLAFEAPCIHSILQAEAITSETSKAIQYFVRSFLDPADGASRSLARDFSGYWVSRAQNSENMSKIAPLMLPWIPFMTMNELQVLLDLITDIMNEHRDEHDLATILHAILQTLQISPPDDNSSLTSSRLLQILTLWKNMPEDRILRDYISSQVSNLVALGVAETTTPQQSINQWVNDVETRWKLGRSPLSKPVVDVIVDLMSNETDDMVHMLSSSLYKSTAIREALATSLLRADSVSNVSISAMRYLIQASTPQDEYIPQICQRFSSTIVKRALRSHKKADRAIHEQALHRLFRICPDQRGLSSILSHQYSKVEDVSCILLVKSMAQSGFITSSDISIVLSNPVKRILNFLGDDNSRSETPSLVMDAFSYLAGKCKSQLDIDEVFFTTCARDYLINDAVMKTFASFIPLARIKPASANRLIQTILNHPRFEQATSSSAREPLISALHALFNTHPQNTCQSTHISPLVLVYRGTLALPDRQILEIFQLFERQRKHSVSGVISQWTSAGGLPSSGALGSIISLDPAIAFSTCTDFPQWRSMDFASGPAFATETQDGLYDPVFITLLLGLVNQADGTSITVSNMDWVQLFRSNSVCVLISCLSSRQNSLRALAWAVFGGLLSAIEASQFQEQNQTLYILSMLSRLYGPMIAKTAGSQKADGSNPIPRLSSFTTLFFAHSIRALYSPASVLYPLTSRFLLQRPNFDPSDPPMLYSMLYSTLENDFGSKEGSWKRERIWMLKFLADGMRGSIDWAVLQRRHTWDLLATMFQANRHDRTVILRVTKVLMKLSKNTRAATSLIERNGLFSWLEIQIQQAESALSDDIVIDTWLQVIENLLLSMDLNRVESRMHGSWRRHCIRCLEGLLQLLRTSTINRPAAIYLQCLATASRILLRMTGLHTPSFLLTRGVEACLQALQYIERSASAGGFDAPAERTWACVQTRLWLVIMRADGDEGGLERLFDNLTSRVVAIRAFVRDNLDTDTAEVVEWATQQTLCTSVTLAI